MQELINKLEILVEEENTEKESEQTNDVNTITKNLVNELVNGI